MTDRSLEYRPYLDGLRGVAVLFVFVFHAYRAGLSGGFIGVDIFFVLSGYLITRILLAKHSKTGRTGIAAFYARRIRRLMPAVVLLVVVVAVREAVWGNIIEMAARLRDAIATLFYAENWNLILQADRYFDESLSPSPFRHAWSLSIEEQFYLVWPLLVVGLLVIGKKRQDRSMYLVLVLAAVSSVVMAMVFDPGLVTRAYYATDTRVHQPLIGAALAFLMVRLGDRDSPGWLWPVTATVSLVALVGAAGLLTGSSPIYYLGGSTVVALLTALLILSLERFPGGWASKAMGWKPLVGLGQISYGFYLWHWPIVLWLTIPDGFGFWQSRVVNLAQFGLTLAISVASFTLLENPIRQGTFGLGRLSARSTIAVGLGTLVVAGVFSYVVLIPDRVTVSAGQVSTADESTVVAEMSEVSEVTREDLAQMAQEALADPSYEPCPDNPRPCVKVEGATAESPTVVLIGDSTAQAYDPALKELARQFGFRYVQAAVGGCPISHRLIATGVDGELHKPSNVMCYEEIPGIYDHVLTEYDPDLIIATSWNETNQHIEDGALLEKGTPEHLEATGHALRATVDYLTSFGASVVLIDVLPPGLGVDCLDRGHLDATACTRPVTPASGEVPYNELFHDIDSERSDVVAVSLTDVVCPGNVCPLIIDGVVMRYDGGHLTGTASRRLAPVIAERLQQAGIDVTGLLFASG